MSNAQRTIAYPRFGKRSPAAKEFSKRSTSSGLSARGKEASFQWTGFEMTAVSLLTWSPQVVR
ncbi:MAG: hypothetical protein LT080_13300 [Thiobacillus sp.]|nr:hypothetical protein [Thiobacillus sp.]